ncbi:MAG: proline--tRNA ligase [Desulfarculales bacterium]|jgi:prolyl-tRNA synthetase|nr:proline--tRNA ligase [Desulfarculales bacterium]
MRFSKFFMPTLKETPADAEVISHQLMLRAGYIRKLAAGVFTWLPMGLKVLHKAEAIVRQEMNLAGCLEVSMPMAQPAELWQESGRWTFYGKELLRFKDRHGNDYCLGPTHEEVITDIVRREVRSYRDLPLNFYQIQNKFRDEVRPRFGIMRAREFLMKDGYSFDADDEASADSYWRMHEAYQSVFRRLGLDFKVVEADSGAIGGSFSHEFMVLAQTGEDTVVSCDACSYAANAEKAEFALPPLPSAQEAKESGGGFEAVSTPDCRTIAEVAAFMGLPPSAFAKTLIYLADGRPVAAVLRGDRALNEIRFKNFLGAAELVLAAPAAIAQLTGGPHGFSGPLGLDIPVYADWELRLAGSWVVGANQADLHLQGVDLRRDGPKIEWSSLRLAAEGDRCPRCGAALGFARGIEVGHIFRLGTKYSASLGALYLDPKGQSRPVVMGCYGIGVSRIIAAAIEQGHDENGIILPPSLAPFTVVVTPMALEGEVWEKALTIYQQLLELGVEAALDDRDLRPGVKFKDSELVGIPLRLLVGSKGLEKGQVEIKERRSGKVSWVEAGQAADFALQFQSRPC